MLTSLEHTSSISLFRKIRLQSFSKSYTILIIYIGKSKYIQNKNVLQKCTSKIKIIRQKDLIATTAKWLFSPNLPGCGSKKKKQKINKKIYSNSVFVMETFGLCTKLMVLCSMFMYIDVYLCS